MIFGYLFIIIGAFLEVIADVQFKKWNDIGGNNFVTSSGAASNFNRWINQKGDISLGGGGNYGADQVQIAAAGVYNRGLSIQETTQLYNYYKIRYS